MNRNPKPERWLQAIASLASLSACLLASRPAAAEVTIAKGDTWDAYVAGRVGAFISYAKGEGYPGQDLVVAEGIANGSLPADYKVQPGGGVDVGATTRDTIYEYDAAGMKLPGQGKLSKLRVRSGYYPNILTLGAHKRFGELKLKVQLSLWGTVEPKDTYGRGSPAVASPNGTRDNSVEADFREGYLQAEGGWGQMTGGRFLSPFGRGMTELDTLYGHGYGVGFPMVARDATEPVSGDLTLSGATGGMSGFGLLGGTYAAGVMYTTPSLAGIKLALGVFDPVTYAKAGWQRTRAPRPEAELSYDLQTSGVALHVFGSGGFQELPSPVEASSVWGFSYGARIELGPVRIGGAGFVGQGAGITYAFDSNPALSSGTSSRTTVQPDGSMLTEQTYELRTQQGYVGMLQVALGPFDVGGGAGQTINGQVDADKTNAATVSTLKTQTGFFGAVVYHVNENFHLDLDYMNGTFRWTNGESQSLNMFNGGVTVTF